MSLGEFYAQHGGLINTLGGIAATVAMMKMKDHLSGRALVHRATPISDDAAREAAERFAKIFGEIRADPAAERPISAPKSPLR